MAVTLGAFLLVGCIWLVSHPDNYFPYNAKPKVPAKTYEQIEAEKEQRAQDLYELHGKHHNEFTDEQTLEMKMRCLAHGYAFKRPAYQFRVSSHLLAVCQDKAGKVIRIYLENQKRFML